MVKRDPLKDVTFVSGGAEMLDEIRPVWEQNARNDLTISTHFSRPETEPDFPRRRKDFEAKAKAGRFRIDVARKGGACIGYCISSVSEGLTGQVDSFCVDEAHRRQGIGSELLGRAVAWMDECGATSKRVYVTYGNDGAVALYQRFGFFPAALVMRQKKDG